MGKIYQPCPSGCGCKTPEDPDMTECACDGPCCTDEWWASPAVPMAGIPVEVACPMCGGYVRGHVWIGTTHCSITTVEKDIIRRY